MKRIAAMALAALMGLTLAACSDNKKIEGVITDYVQVKEYTGPLAVIEDNGKTYYLATSILTVATDVDKISDSFLDEIKNGEVTEIEVSVNGAYRGKTVEVDGENVIVWQSHQIQKIE